MQRFYRWLKKWKLTYKAQVEENFLNSFDMFARATDNLSFKHTLKHFWDKALGLHLVLYSVMVPKTGLDQVFKKQEKEFLCVGLLSNFELVWNFVKQNNYRKWKHSLCSVLVFLNNWVLDMRLEYTKTTKLILLQSCLHKLGMLHQELELLLVRHLLGSTGHCLLKRRSS